jgi:histidinol-phosphatase
MWEKELFFAHEIADSAAEIGLRWFRGEDLEVTHKPDATPVTQADREIERMFRSSVERRFPGDDVIGEEEGGDHDLGGRTWIVDPIDGTKNFAAGVQVWATLIALAVDGRFVLGLVSAPGLGERYTAVRGAGATLNGEPIRVSAVDNLEDAALTTGDVEDWFGTPIDARIRAIEARAKRRRGFGDFWSHMLVARGSFDIMVEPELSIWDFAALVPILQEAGGMITQIDGAPLAHGGSALSTNGRLHSAVVAALSDG